MTGSQRERLTIYGFSFEYPTDCKLEFNPKFKREDGDVALKWPQNFTLFVSWGPLERLKKSMTLEDHANFSLERIKKSVQGKISTIERKEIEVQGHNTLFNHVRVEVPRRGIFGGKSRYQEVRSIHLHCEQSSRYFVIYGTTDVEKSEQQGVTVSGVIDSFKCH